MSPQPETFFERLTSLCTAIVFFASAATGALALGLWGLYMSCGPRCFGGLAESAASSADPSALFAIGCVSIALALFIKVLAHGSMYDPLH